MAAGERDEQFSFGVEERAGTREYCTSPLLRERRKCCFDLAVAAGIEYDELLPDRLRRSLYLSSLALGIGGVRVHEHSDN